MRSIAKNKWSKLTSCYLWIVTVILLLGGCNLVSRLSEVGDGPKLTTIQNPVAKPHYKPVSLPMPTPQMTAVNPNSLWRAGARAFFKDHRAKEIGDIITVSMSLSDAAKFSNKTARARKDKEDHDSNDLLGFEDEIDLPFFDYKIHQRNCHYDHYC